MRPTFVAVAAIVMLLSGCATIQTSSDSEITSSFSRVQMTSGQIGDLSFDYPILWGGIIRTEANPPGPFTETYGFSAINAESTYPGNGPRFLYVTLRRYDSEESRFEEECVSINELCDSVRTVDLIQKEKELAASANTIIGEKPAQFSERYDASGVSVLRQYNFFTGRYSVLFVAGYDIFELYRERYERYEQGNNLKSVLELVQEDFGLEVPDPYRNFIQKYPEETRDMQKFFHEVDLWIRSIKIESEAE